MLLISQEMAQSIVEEIEAVINENINIMDSNGIIIASTDESRLGQNHGGAYRVVSERLSELTVHFDGEYTGSRKGNNYPIVIDGEIVGVVGITGEREQVLKFGHIIKKMTEILLLEYYRTSRLIHDEQAKNNFLSDLLFHDQIDERSIRTRAQVFGVDLVSPVFAVVCEVNYPAVPEEMSIVRSDKTIRERILEEIREDIRFDKKSQMLMHGTAYVLILGAESLPTVKTRLQAIKSKLESAWNVQISCGIGPIATNCMSIRHSYQSAMKTATISTIYFKCAITSYDELGVELIVEEVPRQIRSEFMNKVFRAGNEKEIAEWCSLLSAYFRLNGSINRIAEDLFVHKNTVQYRLGKLKSMTGYDVRDTKDALTLYLAMMFHNSLRV